MKQPKKSRKGRRIVLSIVLVLLIGVVVLALWQKNNIEAVMQFTQYSQEELVTKLEENDQQVEQVLQDALTNAQKVDQETQPEAAQPPETPEQPETPQQTPDAGAPATQTTTIPQPPAVQPPSGPTYEEQLQALVDRVYALREEYVQALEAMEQEAVEAYRNLPASRRTKKGKIEFASSYITRATALERECDGKMDGLVAELTALQKKYGQSMQLVETVKYTYANEKSLKKAWYMSRLEEKGMI